MANTTDVPEAIVPAIEEAQKTAAAIIDDGAAQTVTDLGDAAKNIFGQYIDAFTLPNSYLELMVIGVTIAAGLGASLLLRWFIRRRFKETVDSARWGWLLRPLKLLSPLFVIISLSVTKPIATQFVADPLFFHPATQVALVWLLVYTVHMLVNSNVMAWFISIVLATLIGLQSFGLLHPITALLSKIGFRLGDMEVTILGVVQGIIICVIVFWLSHASATRLEIQLKHSKLNYNVRELLIKFFKIIIYFVALLITLSAIGVDLTAFAVFGGALGVGLGLGLQKITANFVSGVTLLMERSIRQGDLIQVDGIHGYVRELNIRYTLVETFGGQEVSIPNETLTSNNIINWTMSNAKARVEIPVGVAYGSDYVLVRRLLLQAAAEHGRTLKDPATVCYMREFGDSSVKFLLQFWVGNVVDGIYSMQSEVMFRIAELFNEHNITIPFPQRDLNIIQMPELKSKPTSD